MSERDIYSNLVNIKFFNLLGYTKFGKDIRTMATINKIIPDYYCVDGNEKTIFVLELKNQKMKKKLLYIHIKINNCKNTHLHLNPNLVF
jgi:hypothetical protein